MLIGPIKVCDIADIWTWASAKKLYDYNALQDLVFHKESERHRHFNQYDFFVITSNFFDPEYMDDAYGLNWHPVVQETVQTFMAHHNIDKLGVVTSKQLNMCIL